MSEYTGKDVSYYLVEVAKPKRLDPYTAECEDIIEALGMTFAEGCAFKAIWRKCAARTLGRTKAGYKGGLYDAEKAQYYGARMVAAEERLSAIPQCSECGSLDGPNDVHYATCSKLTAPEGFVAEVEATFDELEGVTATCPGCAVSEGVLHETDCPLRVEPTFQWDDSLAAADPEIRCEIEALAGMENAPKAEDPFAGAPEWAKYKAQDADGDWYWYEPKVHLGGTQWVLPLGEGRLESAGVGSPNPNWRGTLIERT